MSGGERASSSPAHRHNSTECRCWYYLALLHIFLRYTLQFTVHYNTLRNVQKIIIWILKFQPRLKTGNFYSWLSVNKTGSLHYITLTIHRWQTQTTELDEHSVTVLLMKWKSNNSDYYSMSHMYCNIIKKALFTQQIESKRTKAQNLSSMKNIVMTTMPSLSRNLLSCNTDK